ncbi:alpha/beta fold hydrolase [Mycobacterium branderi]|uniref:Alpha/beta hydrolase n=1 Tax=Mycobacterium branderi TaxID=43348 RepID=A0A7I7WA91_9MYCO|nr:alpha/beta hydrolase [Mycobacterium branderi]MCV7232400.1 alpha/beta hydrolase [Mycobacterium branderi]ORA36032.1 alpha/beta hydrolase [Mycobacterium branderi]BBZ14424.1 alpha/beta hydrolase fold protein [Mycobacterium branderi]
MITASRVTYNDVGTRALSVVGNGTPIVLLHGYADSADTWRGVLTRLEAAGRRAFAVDLPGFGQADPRRSGALVPQFDAFLDAILAETGPAVLVGNSLGAATAVRGAAHNPAAVKALVALNDPLNARHWLARVARRREIAATFWSRVAHAPVPSTALSWATRRIVPKFLYGPGIVADPEVVRYWSQTISCVSDVATLGRYAFQYAYETTAGHRGVRVSCPTVIVHGARDRIIPVQSSRLLHQQIPGSELVVLPRSGHCPQLDNPTSVVRLIASLLDTSGDHATSTG